MSRRRRPRHPMRCPLCFQVKGASWPGLVMYWHKWQGRKCPGTGMYGGDPNA